MSLITVDTKNVIAKTEVVTTVATRVIAKQRVNVFICLFENQNGAMIATLLSTIAVSNVRPVIILTAGYWIIKSRIFGIFLLSHQGRMLA